MTFKNIYVRHRGLALCVCAGALIGPGPASPVRAEDGDQSFIRDYRRWLDDGRTPARLVDMVRAQSPGWTVIDHLRKQPRQHPVGAKLLFVNRDRSVIMVHLGTEPLDRVGFRMIASHIDTPTPRLDLSGLHAAKASAPLVAKASAYGGIRYHHWQHLPLALVGRVALSGKREVAITLGLDASDDFAFYATSAKNRQLTVRMASIPADKDRPGKPGQNAKKPAKEPLNTAVAGELKKPAGQGAAGATAPGGPGGRDASWLLDELRRRYGVARADLATAELYLVPRQKARDVGLDRALIGAHGQDDRANSYLAWRAATDMQNTPEQTVVVWLVDREEEGSYYPAGATSSFLEAVLAYLVRARGAPATEAALARIYDRSVAISADTPSTLNPNWPEVHERKHAPIVGNGAVLFPHTGRGGKEGGNQAHAPLVRSVVEAFARAGQPLQYGLLGRVDEGGGGTIAKHLANRGIDVIDVGVAGISLHSPMEIFAKDDLTSAYRGFSAWLAGR